MMSVTRRAVEGLRGWPLRGPEDMFTALAELEPEGWEGAVARERDAWRLRLSFSGKQTVNAVVGQWLVHDGELRIVPLEQFAEAYLSDPVEFPPAPEPEPEPEPQEVEEVQAVERTSVPISRAIR